LVSRDSRNFPKHYSINLRVYVLQNIIDKNGKDDPYLGSNLVSDVLDIDLDWIIILFFIYIHLFREEKIGEIILQDHFSGRF
jgi:hypothetical protein